MGEREVGDFLPVPLLLGTKGLDMAVSVGDYSSCWWPFLHWTIITLLPPLPLRPQSGNNFLLLLVSGSPTPFAGSLTLPIL